MIEVSVKKMETLSKYQISEDDGLELFENSADINDADITKDLADYMDV